jgi:hypothetical protein
MKSQANALLHVALGILADVQASYPQYKGRVLDEKRLSLYCRTRGLGLFTLDLPSLDSLLLQGLETGSLMLEGPLSSAVSKRIKVPRLFRGLWLLVFDNQACLKEDADVTAISFLRQLCCLGKKIEVECSPSRIRDTIGEYYDIERTCRPATLRWSEDKLDPDNRLRTLHICDSMDSDLPLFRGTSSPAISGVLKADLERIQRIADLVFGTFASFEPTAYSDGKFESGEGSGFRHGPGAVAVKPSSGYKYSFDNWSAKLNEYFPYQSCGRTAGEDSGTWPRNHEVASRLHLVPKSAKTPRIIAAEPVEHQWCQQLIRSFLQDEITRLFGTDFIDFRKQQRSGELVRQASVDRSLATIDLSSASDRLSCWVVERLLRRNPSLLHSIHSSRTRVLRLHNEVGELDYLKLRKFASQGTAVTFPVQSLVFLIIALGVSTDGSDGLVRKINALRTQVRVYGDDIIIPTNRYERMINALEFLGLKANTSKSYHAGYFRESCGTDCYKGYDVTPVKPKVIIPGGPASCQAVVDTTNNLFNKGYWHASYSLETLLPVRVRQHLRIVGQDTGTIGLSSFSGSSECHLYKRWK